MSATSACLLGHTNLHRLLDDDWSRDVNGTTDRGDSNSIGASYAKPDPGTNSHKDYRAPLECERMPLEQAHPAGAPDAPSR